MGIDLHQGLIEKNYEYWNQKPILKILYGDFYRRIAAHLSNLPDSKIVELGSGLGNIREFIPNCIRTDLFPNPWIDQIENAYRLSFPAETVSDLILTDVFHHLKYPGTALKEFSRVLRKGGACYSARAVHERAWITRLWSTARRADCSQERNRVGRTGRLVAGTDRLLCGAGERKPGLPWKETSPKTGGLANDQNATAFCDCLRGLGRIFQATAISHLGSAPDSKTGKSTGSLSPPVCHPAPGHPGKITDS